MADDTPKAIGPVWIVQPGGGGEVPPGEVLPPDVPPGGEIPTPPIVLPPDLGIWPNPPEGQAPIIEHPIVLPGDPSWEGGEPTHPIEIPPLPEPPAELENKGEPDFYQRKTLGINWDSSFDPSAVVGIYAATGGGALSLVRTVGNDGTSSVTYPQDFTGDVTIRVAGVEGYLEGTTTVE